MFRMHFSSWTIAGSIVLTSWTVSPVQAQLPTIDFNLPSPNLLEQNSDNQIVSGCIRLDGRCLFKLAAPKSDLSNRIQDIEQRLKDVSRIYLKNDYAQLKIRQEPEGKLQNIYISVEEKKQSLVGDEAQGIRLLTITDQDAQLKGVSIDTRTNQVIEDLQQGLKQAKRERQQSFLTRQGGIAVGTAIGMLVTSLAISCWERRSKHSKDHLEAETSDTSSNEAISIQLNNQKKLHLVEVQHRLFQLAQAVIWVGGSLFILSLFPYTRIVQVLIITGLRIPLRIGIVGVGTYVLIRLSYALTEWFAGTFTNQGFLTPEANRRVQLRVSTISGVTKGVFTLTGMAVGALVALSAIGINIGPLLAGAGIIGVAVSFASQSLIKDAINGFLIILEDQYAVGDVIVVGDVGGFVENMNLRITQLRNEEGRLITIPNSEIKIVGNLSSSWSRADLKVPVTYHANVNKALELIERVAQKMTSEPLWREQILEQPEILGVDDFGNRGVIIRVWIKTQPLKQWNVAREFRRRLKEAFDDAGIPIPMPQQAVWLNDSLPLKSSRDEQEVSAN